MTLADGAAIFPVKKFMHFKQICLSRYIANWFEMPYCFLNEPNIALTCDAMTNILQSFTAGAEKIVQLL